jgi:hypothetical protein
MMHQLNQTNQSAREGLGDADVHGSQKDPIDMQRTPDPPKTRTFPTQMKEGVNITFTHYTP